MSARVGVLSVGRTSAAFAGDSFYLLSSLRELRHQPHFTFHHLPQMSRFIAPARQFYEYYTHECKIARLKRHLSNIMVALVLYILSRYGSDTLECIESIVAGFVCFIGKLVEALT